MLLGKSSDVINHDERSQVVFALFIGLKVKLFMQNWSMPLYKKANFNQANNSKYFL